MRVGRALGSGVMAVALAAGGVLVTSGSAHATYSACIDTLAAGGVNIWDHDGYIAQACSAGAGGDEEACVRTLHRADMHVEDEGLYPRACKAAAVKPAAQPTTAPRHQPRT
ncbi:hypothetical protein ACFOSC_24900 [Streptantibioticus rubrisoli]|uniref:Secreted protein n=1 Tax=Streptantibioticus rubrisoli TaxID=1387313 RepID=A0ABT1PB49_9ACTN|nr:hypothetical protein [Streptantibioticus rubrisoli]MCQ4042590.1 hypothetical protein [Streptantibioticus rubrisoli]